MTVPTENPARVKGAATPEIELQCFLMERLKGYRWVLTNDDEPRAVIVGPTYDDAVPAPADHPRYYLPLFFRFHPLENHGDCRELEKAMIAAGHGEAYGLALGAEVSGRSPFAPGAYTLAVATATPMQRCRAMRAALTPPPEALSEHEFNRLAELHAHPGF